MRLDDLDEGPLDYIKKQAADIKQGINTYTQARAQRAAAANSNPPAAQASAAQQKLTKIPSEPYFQNRKQQYLNRGNLAGRSETPATTQPTAQEPITVGGEKIMPTDPRYASLSKAASGQTSKPATTQPMSTSGKATASFGGTAAAQQTATPQSQAPAQQTPATAATDKAKASYSGGAGQGFKYQMKGATAGSTAGGFKRDLNAPAAQQPGNDYATISQSVQKLGLDQKKALLSHLKSMA